MSQEVHPALRTYYFGVTAIGSSLVWLAFYSDPLNSNNIDQNVMKQPWNYFKNGQFWQCLEPSMFTWCSLELLTWSLMYNRVTIIAYFYNLAMVLVLVFETIYVKKQKLSYMDIGFITLITILALTSLENYEEDLSMESTENETKVPKNQPEYLQDQESKNLEDMVK